MYTLYFLICLLNQPPSPGCTLTQVKDEVHPTLAACIKRAGEIGAQVAPLYIQRGLFPHPACIPRKGA